MKTKSITKGSTLKISTFKNSARKASKSIRLKTSASKLKTSDAKRKGLAKKNVKKRDSAASKERLIDAGILIFSTYGFNGSTTKMIAKEANVNEALIARYFGGKEGLFISILHKFMEKKLNEELPYPPQNTVEGELIKYSEARLLSGAEDAHLGKIILSQALTDDKFRKRAIHEIPMQVDPKLKERLQLLLNSNKISKKHKISDLCEDIETYLHGMFIFSVVLFEIPKDEIMRKIRSFITRFTKGITN